MQNGSHHDELDEAPILRSLHREAPFVTPPRFFDELPARVQQRILDETRPRPVALWWTWFQIPAATMLALVLLAAIVWWPRSGTMETPDAVVAEVELVGDELDRADLDDHDLMAAYGEAPELYSEVGHGLGSDELTAYLLNEDLSLDQLIEEL
jgi:hypothetical protein